MSNVLLTTFTNMPDGALDNFRQAFVDELRTQGNNVFLLKTNDICQDFQRTNELKPEVEVRQLLRTIEEFKPDLVVSFNHSGLFPRLVENVECPIAIWLLDGPACLIAADEFRQYAKRYHVFSPVKAFTNDLEVDFGMTKEHIHYLPFCSNFSSAILPHKQEIVFVGTFFYPGNLISRFKIISKDRSSWMRLRELFSSYNYDRDLPWSERVNRFQLSDLLNQEFDEASILNIISTNSRLKYISAISDLDLKIYGTENWIDNIVTSIDTAFAFDPTPITRKEELENAYNSSKIVFNVSHAQARGGLPWRVFDALASSALLVTQDSEDLDTLFSADLEIPRFKTPDEAHKLCLQYLKDEEARKRLVKASNDYLEKHHRFKNRFQTISEATGVSLKEKGSGTFRQFKPFGKQKKHLDVVPAISKLEKALKVSNFQIDFRLQAFQASTKFAFTKDDSTASSKIVEVGETFKLRLQIPESKAFLRLDFGDYYSVHNHPRVRIKNNSTETAILDLDLKEAPILKNQWNYDQTVLTCGYDAFCVFENPFAGCDIEIQFVSELVAGI